MGLEQNFAEKQQDETILFDIKTDHNDFCKQKMEAEWTEIDLEAGSDLSASKESLPAAADDKDMKLCSQAYERFNGGPGIIIINTALFLGHVFLMVYLNFFTDCVPPIDHSIERYRAWLHENTCDITQTSLIIFPAWIVISIGMFFSLWYCCKHLAFKWLMCTAGPILLAWCLSWRYDGRFLQLLFLMLMGHNAIALFDESFGRFGKCMENGREKWLEMRMKEGEYKFEEVETAGDQVAGLIEKAKAKISG